MVNCPNCGNLVPDNSMNCPICGSYVYGNTYVQVKPVMPGRGFGITSMVMGILSLIYAVVGFSVIMEFASELSRYDLGRYGYSAYYTGAIVGASMPSIIFSILALIFGGVSLSKGYKRGMSKSGVVMGIVSIAILFIAWIASANV